MNQTMEFDALLADQSLESCLAAHGWLQGGGQSWRLPLPAGDASLQELPGRGDWLHFELSGGGLPSVRGARALRANSAFFGPAKFVAAPRQRGRCRLDVPAEAVGSTSAVSGFANPRTAWVRAVTSCAVGLPATSVGLPESLQATVNEIQQAGWSASLDDGQVHVHLQLPGVYRQVSLEANHASGVRLSTELITLGGVSRLSARAMSYLALHVNSRLPLVRLANAESAGRRVLRAEVSFGGELIPGTWLVAALHMVETAVALSARELEALCDPELARLTLAASAP